MFGLVCHNIIYWMDRYVMLGWCVRQILLQTTAISLLPVFVVGQRGTFHLVTPGSTSPL